MKELVITPPEGFEVDKEHSTFEKIVFKPIDSKPRSWEEFCEKYPVKKGEAFIDASYEKGIMVFSHDYSDRDTLSDRNVLPTKEYTEAFLALMQLVSLRQAWIGDWKPKTTYPHWCMYYDINTNSAGYDQMGVSHVLEFPTQEMAKEFFDCFKDLIEQAKILL